MHENHSPTACASSPPTTGQIYPDQPCPHFDKFFFFFNWKIIALQCCVGFFPTTKLISHKWKWSCSVMSDSLWPVDCSPPSSSVHGILHARILEWVAISFYTYIPSLLSFPSTPHPHPTPLGHLKAPGWVWQVFKHWFCSVRACEFISKSVSLTTSNLTSLTKTAFSSYFHE